MVTLLARGVRSAYSDRDRLRNWISRVAKDHGRDIGEVNYVLMSDPGLLEYNRRYLEHDELTDVITFNGETGTGVSGDVLMSLDRISENATTYSVPLQQELRRVMVHGLLHLLGHDDKTPAQKRAMRALEDRYLAAY